jgi:GDPmannose 4,6-dehydratase
MKKKTAIITGITGQDGAYLAEYLLQKGYNVVGLTRSYTSAGLSKLTKLGIENMVEVQECDLMDYSSIIRILQKFNPDEFYNLAAQSSVAASFNQPIGTIHFNSISVLNILEAIRSSNAAIRFYQASSSEMFGNITDLPIREESVLNPVSPYAISKATAHWIVRNYRDAYGIFACSGILFNHESALRDDTFFVKKVIVAALKIKSGKMDMLKLGNIMIRRDFGSSKEYVKVMHAMLQHDRPDDYIVSSGKSVLLKDIVDFVFKTRSNELNEMKFFLQKLFIVLMRHLV